MTRNRLTQVALASILGLTAIVLFGLSASRRDSEPGEDHVPAQSLGITVLSTRPDMITGGDALVRIDVSGIPPAQVRVVLNDEDISDSFALAPDNQSLEGMVEGLQEGENVLIAMDGAGTTRTRTELRNHPLTGPVISGEHLAPFLCTTEAEGLGEALDDDCTAATQVNYFYRNLAGDFLPITDITAPYPDDLASTVINKRPVPFVVRVESGTINRAIYHLALLDDPQRTYGEWDGASWNGRLVFSFGGGCGTHYNQGSRSSESVLDGTVLERGFAHMVSSFNVMGHQCNDNLSAETLMMLKEHFIENYGLPVWTLGNGASGGAIQQLLIAQNYPGLLNGLMPGMAFADSFSVRPGVADCRILKRYFDDSALPWNDEQRQAVEGYSPGTCAAWERSFLDVIVADTGCDIPEALQYNAETNRGGARCTLYDTNVASLGRDPVTGFAWQALDNVGVQYGLQALRDGVISGAQFIDLNARVGGFDRDGKPVATRTHGQLPGLEAAYRSGRVNQGMGSLASVPILHTRPYNDPLGDIHDRFRDFQIRARLRKANGSAENQIIWLYPDRARSAEIGALALDTMREWLDRLTADHSDAPLLTRVANARPEVAVDACWDPSGQRIDEPFEFMGEGRCNALYPSHTNPRLAAGAPLVDDAIKCALRPPVQEDYGAAITAEQWQALLAAFPEGVCDYSMPGPGQVPPAGTFLRLPL